MHGYTVGTKCHSSPILQGRVKKSSLCWVITEYPFRKYATTENACSSLFQHIMASDRRRKQNFKTALLHWYHSHHTIASTNWTVHISKKETNLPHPLYTLFISTTYKMIYVKNNYIFKEGSTLWNTYCNKGWNCQL